MPSNNQESQPLISFVSLSHGDYKIDKLDYVYNAVTRRFLLNCLEAWRGLLELGESADTSQMADKIESFIGNVKNYGAIDDIAQLRRISKIYTTRLISE